MQVKPGIQLQLHVGKIEFKKRKKWIILTVSFSSIPLYFYFSSIPFSFLFLKRHLQKTCHINIHRKNQRIDVYPTKLEKYPIKIRCRHLPISTVIQNKNGFKSKKKKFETEENQICLFLRPNIFFFKRETRKI